MHTWTLTCHITDRCCQNLSAIVPKPSFRLGDLLGPSFPLPLSEEEKTTEEKEISDDMVRER